VFAVVLWCNRLSNA